MIGCECKSLLSALKECLNLAVVGANALALLAGSTAMQLLRMSPNGMWLETVRLLTATLDVGPCAFEWRCICWAGYITSNKRYIN